MSIHAPSSPVSPSIPDRCSGQQAVISTPKCPLFPPLLTPSPHSLLPIKIQRSGPQLTSNLLLPIGDWGLQTLAWGPLSPSLALAPLRDPGVLPTPLTITTILLELLKTLISFHCQLVQRRLGAQRDWGGQKRAKVGGKQGKSSPLSVEMALRNQILTVREQNLLKLGQGCVWGAVGMAGCLGSEGNEGSGRRDQAEAGRMR